MPNPIPAFTGSYVLPPHLGDPTKRTQLSPYPCTTVDLCRRFGTSDERRTILANYLNFRAKLNTHGLTRGFQWLDGSFMEDKEARTGGTSPSDLDLVTIYWGYDSAFQTQLAIDFPEFASPGLAKANYLLDHYPIDAGHCPEGTVENTRYIVSLFSHSRAGVWKGMVRIELNTPDDDTAAREELAEIPP